MSGIPPPTTVQAASHGRRGKERSMDWWIFGGNLMRKTLFEEILGGEGASLLHLYDRWSIPLETFIL
jgi:hypothetical protein